jgi:hypothetical protein
LFISITEHELNDCFQVKEIIYFMIYVAYHLKLELSFLMDEFAMPPPAPDENSFPGLLLTLLTAVFF